MQKLALREDAPYPCGTCLLSPRKPSSVGGSFLRDQFPGARDIVVSVNAKSADFITVHEDDVVNLKWSDGQLAVGKVLLLASVAGECMLWITLWTKLPTRNMYDTQGSTYFALLEDVVNTCIYRMQGQLAYVVPPRAAVLASL